MSDDWPQEKTYGQARTGEQKSSFLWDVNIVPDYEPRLIVILSLTSISVTNPGYIYEARSDSCVRLTDKETEYHRAVKSCERDDAYLSSLNTPELVSMASELLALKNRTDAWAGAPSPTELHSVLYSWRNRGTPNLPSISVFFFTASDVLKTMRWSLRPPQRKRVDLLKWASQSWNSSSCYCIGYIRTRWNVFREQYGPTWW